jgi:hypothetical protein
MGIATSLFFVAVGAILAFAVSDQVDGVNLVAIGWILMIVGVLGALLSAIFWSSWGGPSSHSRTRVVERDREVI